MVSGVSQGQGMGWFEVPIGQFLNESGEHRELAAARLVETGLHFQGHVLRNLAQDV